MSENKKEKKYQFEIKDLPPSENVNGGLHSEISHYTASSLSGKCERKHTGKEDQTHQTRTRMFTLFTLTVIGSLVMGATARLVFNGWVLAIASLTGALAGLFLAAICWTSGKQ